MSYRFVQEQHDYTDFSAGQVLYSLPKRPVFPVRLGSEIFQRCLAFRARQGVSRPCSVYDPCCGTGYLLTCLAYLHPDEIEKIIASDIDVEALHLARKNLSLLTQDGLGARLGEIQNLFELYGKASHAAAMESALRLRQRLAKTHGIATHLFRADATNRADIVAGFGQSFVDVVITDVPYEQLSSWHVSDDLKVSLAGPVWHLLDALLPVLTPHSVVAIGMNKQQKAHHEKYRRLSKFKIGKRQIVLLSPAE